MQVIATKGPWYVFYFLFVIFLGPFYLINLVLAVVSLSYEQETAALQDQVLRVSDILCTMDISFISLSARLEREREQPRMSEESSGFE